MSSFEGAVQTDIIQEMDAQEDVENDIIKEGHNASCLVNGQQELSVTESQDEEMEEDMARSEATFRYTFHEFSKIKGSVLSPPCFVRNLPWKIMIMPKWTQSQKALSVFLQCNAESESMIWRCYAAAELSLLSCKEGQKPFCRRIKHTFHKKENDWGFSHFISLEDIFDPDKGYIKNDSITFEAHVIADAPHGVNWDSKKYSGYVGLKNQGATCYMNSLLQSLYFTNQLRKAVYKMPSECYDFGKNITLGLQRVFHEMQFSDKPVGTKKLTKNFGWETLDSFTQHDVQEFLRVLLDKLENTMKGTSVEGTIQKLFEGKMVSFIKCQSVNYTSTKVETFYDIQLNVKGKNNIYESFEDYVRTEILDGDNKYDAGEHGLQDAEKGVHFSSFPPVLHLHLMRFQYDPVTDCSRKFNERFEFYDKINLHKYLKSGDDNNTDAEYTLQAVFVHSGDNQAGHYVVFINPRGDGQWCKFDDDVVSKCSKQEAIEQNYGGEDDDNSTVYRCTNAYMLVYIKNSQLCNVLEDIKEEDIPSELIERLEEERRLEEIKRKERSEAHLNMNVNVILEESFEGHQGGDLCDPEHVICYPFRVSKQATLLEFMELLSDSLKYNIDQIRIWPFRSRNNQTLRPSLMDLENDLHKYLREFTEVGDPWVIFVELVDPNSGLDSLPPFDKDQDVLLFFKWYDPKHKKIHYCGHRYVSAKSKLQDLMPILNSIAGFPEDTQLVLYEEITPNMVEQIENLAAPLEKVLEELLDGDIIVFEKGAKDSDRYELPTCRDYFREISSKMEVVFCDRSAPSDPGFVMELSEDTSYNHMAKAVAEKLNTVPCLLQFFKCQLYKDCPSFPIKNFDGTVTLKDFVGHCRRTKKIFYLQLLRRSFEL